MDFDFNQYWDKIKSWFEELPDKIKNLPDWYKALPLDEKIAWGVLISGVLLMLLSILFF